MTFAAFNRTEASTNAVSITPLKSATRCWRAISLRISEHSSRGSGAAASGTGASLTYTG